MKAALIGISAIALSGCAWTDSNFGTDFSENNANAASSQSADARPSQPATVEQTYSQQEVVSEMANFFGVTAEAAGEAVERVFAEQGEPVGFIRGEEVAGAIGVGLRYGQGEMVLRSGTTRNIFWQGPSIGFDTGANASKVFTLIYDLPEPDAIYQRFPGVSGSAYFIAGLGVNYQQNGDVVLAPIRAGVGLRAGVNIGYLHYTRERQILPL
jgi:hypothetical protein